MDPKTVKFANPMWAFDQLLPVLKHKNVEEAKLQAIPPPQQAQPTGQPSPPKNMADPSQAVGQNNPEVDLASILG